MRSYKVLVGALRALQVFQFFMVPYGVVISLFLRLHNAAYTIYCMIRGLRGFSTLERDVQTSSLEP